MSKDPLYLLRHGEGEGVRLHNQHFHLVKYVSSGRLIYDSTVKLDSNSNVLDAGTGAGSWALELASQAPDGLHVDAIDISARVFPSKPPQNVSFMECSVAQLPANWTGRFNFVHQRLLAAGIIANEWPIVISNIYRVLQAGGSIQFMELDLMSWPRVTEAEDKLLGARHSLAEKNGLLPDAGKKIPKLLEDAGFTDICSEIKYIPLGEKFENSEDGLRGNASISGAWRAMKRPIMEAGVGNFSSEKEYDEIVDALVEQWNAQEGGTQLPVYLICARKP